MKWKRFLSKIDELVVQKNDSSYRKDRAVGNKLTEEELAEITSGKELDIEQEILKESTLEDSYRLYTISRLVRTKTQQYATRKPKKRALLIGINYLGQKNELRGCINDTRLLEKYLTKLGYQDIMIMTDEKLGTDSYPTKRHIRNAMAWLVADAQPEDSFFFHFSGHGGQQLGPDKNNEIHEAIFPVDHLQRGLITDTELYATLIEPLPPGTKLMSTFDCCHSGSLLDLPYTYFLDGSLKPLVRSNRRHIAQTSKGIIAALSRWDKSSALLELKHALHKHDSAENRAKEDKTTLAQVISVTGCKDYQKSADTIDAGETHGAMTYNMIKILEEHNGSITCIELLRRLRENLKAKYNQRPQLSTGFEMDVTTVKFSLI